MYKRGLHTTRFFPRLQQGGCCATALNSYVIDADGDMYKCWVALLDGKELEPLTKAMVDMLKPVKSLLHTATADSRREFAGHKEIADKLGIDVYFARPYHSWERGANENMNGLIRQYIPKGSSFDGLTNEHINMIQDKLSNRPRKKTRISDTHRILFC